MAIGQWPWNGASQGKGDVGRVSARKHCLHSRKTNHDDADLDHERYDDGDDADNLIDNFDFSLIFGPNRFSFLKHTTNFLYL